MTNQEIQTLVDNKDYSTLKKLISDNEIFIVDCVENDEPVKKFITKNDYDNYKEHKRQEGVCYTIQYSTKILLNSLYGALSTPHFRFYDPSLSRSVTLSGQTVIKNNGEMLNEYFNKDIFDNKIVKQKFKINHDHADSNVMTYTDTDSVASNSIIRTNHGSLSIETLFMSYKNKMHYSQHGHEIVDTSKKDLNCMTFNETTKCVELGKITKLIRHKVTKKKWTIKANGKTVSITNDHSCMVVRDGDVIEVKPSEIRKTDKLIILK